MHHSVCKGFRPRQTIAIDDPTSVNIHGEWSAMFPRHPGGRVLGIMAVFALALAVATFQIYEFLGGDQIYCWRVKVMNLSESLLGKHLSQVPMHFQLKK